MNPSRLEILTIVCVICSIFKEAISKGHESMPEIYEEGADWPSAASISPMGQLDNESIARYSRQLILPELGVKGSYIWHVNIKHIVLILFKFNFELSLVEYVLMHIQCRKGLVSITI